MKIHSTIGTCDTVLGHSVSHAAHKIVEIVFSVEQLPSSTFTLSYSMYFAGLLSDSGLM